MNKTKTAAFAVLATLVSPSFAQDDLSLDALLNLEVTSSGFFATTQDKSTGHAYMFSDDEIKKYNVRSMDELLENYVPGMSFSGNKMNGGQTIVRGMDLPARILFMQDSDASNRSTGYGRDYSHLRSPLMGDIESVEVILGPGALVHGSGAVNGFINTLSPTGESRPGLWSRVDYSTGDKKSLEVSYGKVFDGSKKMNFFLYAGTASSDGKYPTWDGINLDKAGEEVNNPGVIGTSVDTSTLGANYKIYDGVQRVDRIETPNQKYLARFVLGDSSDMFEFDAKLRYEKSSISTGTPTIAFKTGNHAFVGLGDGTRDPSADTGNADGECRDGWSPTCVYNIATSSDKLEANSGNVYPVNRLFSFVPNMKLNFNKQNSLEIIPSLKFFATTLESFDWFKDQYRASGNPAEMLVAGNAERSMGTKIIYRNKSSENVGTAVGLQITKKDFSGEKSWLFDEKFDIETEVTDEFSWTEYALFAEHMREWDDTAISVGARYDGVKYGELIENSVEGDMSKGVEFRKTPEDVSSTTYRAAIAHNLSKTDNVKAAFQTAFRFPEAGNYRWLSIHNKISENEGLEILPDLKPEESQAIELSYTKKMLENKLVFDATYTYTRLDNAIVWMQISDNNYKELWNDLSDDQKAAMKYWMGASVNAEKTISISSLETLLTYKDGPIDLQLVYSFAMPHGDSGEEVFMANNGSFTNQSEHTLKGRASYDWEKFRLGTNFYYRTGIDAEMYDASGARKIYREDIMGEDSYKIDVHATYKSGKGYNITGYVNNVTAAKIGRPSGSADSHELLVNAQYFGRVIGLNTTFNF